MLTLQFDKLKGLVSKDEYSSEKIDAIVNILSRNGTFELKPNLNSLFPASSGQKYDAVSGYQHVWFRDNVMVANYFIETGRADVAFKTIQSITLFLIKYRGRFDDIIRGKVNIQDPMMRPHVRFNDNKLEELPGHWANAQNDALGYVLWLRFRLANQYGFELSADECKIYSCFPPYFNVIEYWRDPDSGHWEENREIRNSSIGVVVAGLEEMEKYMAVVKFKPFSYDGQDIDIGDVSRLIGFGRAQLQSLPGETSSRTVDSAQLFLIYPLGILDRNTEDIILRNVLETLQGEFGIKRYLGDSYWAPGYKNKFSEKDRTRDFSQDIAIRNVLVPKEKRGKVEAEWCIFDPIISVIHGKRFLSLHRDSDRQLQINYFNRSLAQLTRDGQCPEAYYIENELQGMYVPNDHVPLAWTQANLGIALEYMKRSSSLS
ncbi:MAG: glycoside hydrolase family 15 protein [Minisyncoccia bacterium]